MREQIVTTWQGFSGHRGILGKVRSAERQGFRGEPGTQGDVRAAGDMGYKAPLGGLGKWDKLSKTSTIISSNHLAS